jgi:hypothetical protein
MKHRLSSPRPDPASRGREAGSRTRRASARLASAILEPASRPRETNCRAGTEEQARQPTKGTPMGVGSVSRFRIRRLPPATPDRPRMAAIRTVGTNRKSGQLLVA